MAVVKLGGGTVQVVYLTHITDENNKVLKRNVKGVVVMHLADIKIVDNFYDSDAKLVPNKCRIFHEDVGWMVLQEPYDEIVHLKMDGTIQVKGFRQRHYGKVPVKRTSKKRKTIKNGKPRNKPVKRSGNTRNPRKNA